MTLSIKGLIGEEDLVALRYGQALEPVEGRAAVVDPPTYPGPLAKRGGSKRCSEYVINDLGDGIRMCELDTVPSQANRMEASYRGSLADLIPRHAVEAGGRREDLTELPHRLADASIRATGFAVDIRAAFEAFDAADAAPLARLGPTSLVYGAWDSRDTRVSVPRAIESRITAHDVVECTRSAQYTGAFAQDELGLSDREWRTASQAGFAPSPATGRPGGLRVRGEIVQSASIMLDVLRRYRTADGVEVLAGYLLGLALGGLLVGARRYHLRSRCALVPSGPATWETVGAAGERRAVEVDAKAVLEELRAVAGEWSAAANIELGGEPEIHHYDPVRARRMLKKKPPSVEV